MTAKKNKNCALRLIDSMADVAFDTFMIYSELSTKMSEDDLAKFQQMRYEFLQMQMKMSNFIGEFAKKFD